ncbi:unnamed protein product [Sphagnum troendelagicum]
MAGEGSSRGLRRQSSATVCAEFNYRLGKTMGFGAFSKVKSATHSLTGKKVAIKIMNRHKMKDMEEKVRRELKVMQVVMHPHIVRLYEIIETHSDIYVVMEYVESGDLFDYIVLNGRLPEEEARHFFQQIIAGVEYCHRNRVVHRDLKPENLLLDAKRRSVKIADFGLSNIMHDGQFLKTSCGSPNYAAPEVIQRRYYAGPEVDVWSCGVILYAMLCGILPFDDENISSLYQKITDGIYTLPCHLSMQARDLITRILKADPLHRITIPEIQGHPWFRVQLPLYLAVPPPEYAQQLKRIDDDVASRVEKLGFDRKHLIDCLLRRETTKATVTYYLLLDSLHSENQDDYLESEFDELEAIACNREDPTQSVSVTAGISNHQLQSSVEAYVHTTSLEQKPKISALMSSTRIAPGGNWAVGLQSQADPSEIMMEVLKTLQELDIVWKVIGAYSVRCRWVPPPPNPSKSCNWSAENSLSESPMTLGSFHSSEMSFQANGVMLDDNKLGDQFLVRFEIQLFRIREGKYLLDLQRVGGPSFLFLELCSSFLTEVGAV